jgi:hypothetical protein
MRYLLPSLPVALLAALVCFAIASRHLAQAQQLPVAAETVRQGLRQDLRESAAATAVAVGLALLLTATMGVRSGLAKSALAVVTLVAFYFSTWPIQDVADAADWAHRSAFRFVPILTAWVAVPAAILVRRSSRVGDAR